VEFHRSAFKHGVAEAAIVHALVWQLAAFDLDSHGDPPRVLAIGPDLAGNLLEIVWLELAADRMLVIHAMPLRAEFHALLPKEPDDD
jgi:hypothetical protein